MENYTFFIDVFYAEAFRALNVVKIINLILCSQTKIYSLVINENFKKQ